MDDSTFPYQSTTSDTGINHCPYCHAPCELATSLRAVTPSEGDLSICLYCGELSTFGINLRLEKISPEQLQDLREHGPEAMAEIELIRQGVVAPFRRNQDHSAS